jgi:RimJ/RimL family protein N-acetyltransferase
MRGHRSPVLPDVLPGPTLDLVLVTVTQLLARNASSGPVPLGYPDPADVLHPDRAPLHYRVPQVLADPTVNPWLLRLAVERATSTIVGLAGFHGAPDDRGMLEIGYSTLPAHRRRGHGREMATTLWAAATEHPAVRVLRATVEPGNEASLAIIRGAGLVHVGEQQDPEDGLELVFERVLRPYRGPR